MTPGTIYHGDCLEVMRSWPDGCVDLVFCSPPYEDVRLYGEVQFNLKGQDWVDWAKERFVECMRVCKGLVCWVVEGKTRAFRWSATPSLLEADLHRAGVKLRHPCVYGRFGIPGSGGPDWLRNDHERIICASHGKLPWSENTAMGHPPKWAPGGEMSYRLSDGTRRNQWGASAHSTGGERGRDGKLKRAKPRPSHRFHTKRTVIGDMQTQDYKPPAVSNPGNVIWGNVGGGNMGDPLAHENEAPFPEWLPEFFILSFCPPGGIACDPFSGSGTTVAVAKKNGRQYVGIEVREDQVEVTKKRLKGAQRKLFT